MTSFSAWVRNTDYWLAIHFTGGSDENLYRSMRGKHTTFQAFQAFLNTRTVVLYAPLSCTYIVKRKEGKEIKRDVNLIFHNSFKHLRICMIFLYWHNVCNKLSNKSILTRFPYCERIVVFTNIFRKLPFRNF